MRKTKPTQRSMRRYASAKQRHKFKQLHRISKVALDVGLRFGHLHGDLLEYGNSEAKTTELAGIISDLLMKIWRNCQLRLVQKMYSFDMDAWKSWIDAIGEFSNPPERGEVTYKCASPAEVEQARLDGDYFTLAEIHTQFEHAHDMIAAMRASSKLKQMHMWLHEKMEANTYEERLYWSRRLQVTDGTIEMFCLGTDFWVTLQDGVYTLLRGELVVLQAPPIVGEFASLADMEAAIIALLRAEGADLDKILQEEM